MDDLYHPERITQTAIREPTTNLRWLREFVAKGSFTKAQFQALCTDYGNACLCCRAKVRLVPDHVVPLCKGGSNDITNIQPLCQRCNSLKGSNTTDYRKVN